MRKLSKKQDLLYYICSYREATRESWPGSEDCVLSMVRGREVTRTVACPDTSAYYYGECTQQKFRKCARFLESRIGTGELSGRRCGVCTQNILFPSGGGSNPSFSILRPTWRPKREDLSHSRKPVLMSLRFKTSVDLHSYQGVHFSHNKPQLFKTCVDLHSYQGYCQ